MKPAEALDILKQVAAKFVADGQTHQVITSAITVLAEAIEPPKPAKEGPAKP